MEVLTKFQSTPLREGRPAGSFPSISASSFQSTPLREGRPDSSFDLFGFGIRFNPRPSVRGDRCRRRPESGPHGFNPRPSVRGDEYPA